MRIYQIDETGMHYIINCFIDLLIYWFVLLCDVVTDGIVQVARWSGGDQTNYEYVDGYTDDTVFPGR